MTNHPTFGLVDVYAATIASVAFKPGLHVNYSETVLPMKDGLPKMKDFPAELGGSGETMPEVPGETGRATAAMRPMSSRRGRRWMMRAFGANGCAKR